MKLSIVTAIKDGFEDFKKTIPTILSQTEGSFEWIIVDDGSKLPLAEAFPALGADSRVTILRNSAGRGQTKSLNDGIRRAKGEWIVRMDGDDLAAPERLQKISQVTGQPGATLIFSDYNVIDENDRVWADISLRHPLPPSFFTYLEKQNNPICHPTTAFLRSKADGELRLFREDLVNAQDFALWKEILEECGPGSFIHLPYSLLSYRIARNSLSGARAPEQSVELEAIRSGRMLKGEQSRSPVLSENKKDSMQAFRILYYRFIGLARPALLTEELGLLKAACGISGLVPKALFFVVMRPWRKFLLRFAFSGIYG